MGDLPTFGQLAGGLSNGSNRQANSPLHGGSAQALGAGISGAAALAQQQSLYDAMLAQAAARVLTERIAEPVENTGLELGEVIAWRAWEYHPEAGLLTSCAVGNFWLPGEPMKGDPDQTNLTGVNAFKEPHKAYDEYGSHRLATCVTGKIALWGEIIEHEDGYRAQFGMPVSFDIISPKTSETKRLLTELRHKYFGDDLPPPTPEQECRLSLWKRFIDFAMLNGTK